MYEVFTLAKYYIIGIVIIFTEKRNMRVKEFFKLFGIGAGIGVSMIKSPG